MLEIINDLPSHVVGVHATGEISQEDIETVLIPAIDKLVDKTDKIHYLLHLDTDLLKWDIGAWYADAKIGLKYFTKWTKIAVVTDKASVRKFTDAFGFVVPGDARGFSVAEMELAKQWVSQLETDKNGNSVQN